MAHIKHCLVRYTSRSSMYPRTWGYASKETPTLLRNHIFFTYDPSRNKLLTVRSGDPFPLKQCLHQINAGKSTVLAQHCCLSSQTLQEHIINRKATHIMVYPICRRRIGGVSLHLRPALLVQPRFLPLRSLAQGPLLLLLRNISKKNLAHCRSNFIELYHHGFSTAPKSITCRTKARIHSYRALIICIYLILTPHSYLPLTISCVPTTQTKQPFLIW